MEGNPERITSLADVARPGVRVVLCFPKGCLGLAAWTIQEVLAHPADLFVARFTRAQRPRRTRREGRLAEARRRGLLARATTYG
jgi:hypothetical protein